MSNRVQGARLKAAASAHARKQLGALGVPLYRKAGAATFKGDKAYAYWSVTSTGDVESYGINYPAMPDNALVSRREADLISAYTLHEIGHIAFTDNQAAQGQKALVFHLWNGIEDARIEHAVIASGRARGSRSAFKRLMSKFTAVSEGKGFNPSSINAAPFALALVCRAAFGDGNGYAKTLLDRIPEPKRSLYATAADRAKDLTLDRQGSWGALALAKEFLDGWLAIEPNALKQPDPIQPAPGAANSEEQQEQQSDEDDSAGSPTWDDQDGDDQEDDADADNSGNSSFNWDDDDSDEDGDADGSGDDEADDGVSAADLQRDMHDAAEDIPDARDDSVLFDQSDDDDDDATDGGGDGFSDHAFEDQEDTFEESRVIKAEPDVDDVFANILARTKAPIDLPPLGKVSRSVIRNWSTVVELDDAGQRRHYRKLHKSALPALKAQLYRILRAPERCGWDGGALGGRFDGKRTSRMMAGSECVFKRRWISEGINTAVSVVIDMSGSMKGEPIKESVDLGWTIAEAAEAAGCEVEVLGFTTKYASYDTGGHSLSGDWVSPDSRSHTLSCPATLVVAKRWQDKCANSAQYFSIMKRAADGGTPDYSAIRTVAEQLSTHRAQRKLVIVITDGCGEIGSMAELTKSAYDLYGVDVIGFGIGISERHFKQAYALGSVVNGYVGDLHKTCLKSVADQLAQRDSRRVA